MAAVAEAPGNGHAKGHVKKEEPDALQMAVMPSKDQRAGSRNWEPINLYGNFYEVRTASISTFQYHVSIEPEVQGRKARSMLVKRISENFGFSEEEVKQGYMLDGYCLWSKKKFPDVIDAVAVWKAGKPREGEAAPVEITYKVSVKFTKKEEETANMPKAGAQMYNILLRRSYREQKLIPVGRNYFNPRKAAQVRGGAINIWPGYSSTIHDYEEGPLLNVDSVTKVMRNENVLDILTQIRNKVGGNMERLAQVANEELKGQVVLTPYNNQTYKIESIDLNRNPGFEFESKEKNEDGTRKKVSIIDYMATKYHMDNIDPQQPLIIAESKRSKGEVLLLPQLSNMTGMTDEMVANFSLMKDVAQYTRVKPSQKMNMLQLFRDGFNEPTAAASINEWDMQINPHLLQLQGRVMPTQEISIASQSQKADPKKGDWNRLVGRNRLKKTMPLTAGKWSIVYVNRDAQAANAFMNKFQEVAPPLGIELGRPIVEIIQNDSPETYIAAFDKILQPDHVMAVFIVPKQNKDRYDRIKTHLCLKKPLPSQCIVAGTLQKERMLNSICQKICVQMQCKQGGEPWTVNFPFQQKVMVVGIDVYHDSQRRGESVLALCATTNKDLSKYYTCPTHQRTGQEVGEMLGQSMSKAVDAFAEANGGKPDMIIIYRDGVGDGMIKGVMGHEIPSIQKALGEMESGYDPKMCFMLVKKRVNVRFFTQRKDNPPPGMVVDHTVIKQGRYEFYLQAQQVNQGTATPSAYHVLVNNTPLPMAVLEELTYKLCHMYYNWSGTIRVPAPVMYAHKLAFLIGQSVHQEPNERLAHRLYFL